MMIIKYIHISICTAMVILSFICHGQNTVGLLDHDDLLTQDGYTLFFPHNQKNVYLIDNCGRLVHQWTDSVYVPGNGVYLLDNGDMIRCGKRTGTVNPIINKGGAGEVFEKRDWNNQLLWRYTYNSPTFRMHHDIEPLPNGNVLVLAWELKTKAEAGAMGKDTAIYGGIDVWPDHIIEVEQTGLDTGNIVWEWHAWDHLVQDFDSLLPNYDVVADRPERININFDPFNNDDWMHCNSIDYNADLDQIILSVPHFDEIWVIDHSTTTAEAASSTGGNSGRGGDLLYRWGNPAAYDRGDSTDQKLFFQHDAQWVDTGDPNDPDQGKILVFNNRVGGTYSRVDMFIPPIDSTGAYVIGATDPFGPDSLHWSYQDPVPDSLYSVGLSGAEKLPNGNFLITSGTQGRLFEVTSAGQHVWEYKVPLDQGIPVAQGTIISNFIRVFKGRKYPASHPFLSTQGLSPIGYIELQPDSTFCGTITVGIDEDTRSPVLAYPNPTTGVVSVTHPSSGNGVIFDPYGRSVMRFTHIPPSTQLDLSPLPAGIYLIHCVDGIGTIIKN